jgi:hypothetical protein
MSLSRELENYRDRGQLPAALSKRFINALKTAERTKLAADVRGALEAALDTDASEVELVNLCNRIVRVRKIRKLKGEL